MHLTNNNAGMIIRKDQEKQNAENVVMGNGTTMKADSNGDLLGTMYDKNGKELKTIKLQEVTYAKNTGFNLFSIMTMMKKGWTLTV